MLGAADVVLYVRTLGEYEWLDEIKEYFEMSWPEITCLTNMEAIRDYLKRELGLTPCEKRYIRVMPGDRIYVLTPAVPLAKVGRFVSANDVDRLVRKGWMAFYRVDVMEDSGNYSSSRK